MSAEANTTTESNLYDMYMHDVSQFPLLTTEQETDLGRRIADGVAVLKNADFTKLDFLPKLSDNTVFESLVTTLDLSLTDCETLAAAYSARDMFIVCNLRLVVSLANSYADKTGSPVMDVIQLGNLGLEHAVDKFDYHKGFKFSTYATWWIRQSILRELPNINRLIPLPDHMNQKLRSLRKYDDLLASNDGQALVMKLVGVDYKGLSDIKYAAAVARPVSLDAPTSQESDRSLGDIVASEDGVDVDLLAGRVSGEPLLQELMQVIAHKPLWVQTVVRAFGLDGNPSQSLDEIARQRGVSRQAVGQMLNYAIRKMREHADYYGLESPFSTGDVVE